MAAIDTDDGRGGRMTRSNETRRIFARQEAGSRSRVADLLRAEPAGGVLLVAATVVALSWANASSRSYEGFWATAAGVGPGWLHLDDMTLASWVSSGALTLFFFVVGVELKRELVVGDLADLRAAALPVAAAAGGMLIPALVWLAVSGGAAGTRNGWAVPVATDVAFALGVLSLARGRVNRSLRVVLLSLAVADDVGGIAIIAIVFTGRFSAPWLLASVALLVLAASAHRRRWRSPWLHVPVAALVWLTLQAAGVQPTIAGVGLGLLVRTTKNQDEEAAPAERLGHLLAPVSTGLIVPLFALSTTGVSLAPAALGAVATDPADRGIVLGLVVGKFVGVIGGAWLAVRLRVARLPDGFRWRNLVPLGLLAGIGYTVCLLVSGLALPPGEPARRAATAILIASAIASLLALVALRTPLAAGRRPESGRSPRPEPDPESGPVAGRAWPVPPSQREVVDPPALRLLARMVRNTGSEYSPESPTAKRHPA